ncbi:MAG: ThiF family adenylyltransferase [Opitutus sp.]|nr:ThiF family adenylyltransferase [Opitutus sp.]
MQFSVLPEYFHEGTDIRPGAIIVGCVDNHAARNAILQVADRIGALVVLAGNEYTEAQAFVYLPQWKGTPRDPRVRYPEIVTDQSDDPRRPQSCQGAEQRAHPQLAMANFSAANFALWLLWFYLVEAPGLDRGDAEGFQPRRVQQHLQSLPLGAHERSPTATRSHLTHERIN